ncbi:hypothetical protein SLEP1_g49325 [Rubroshorea leprosula]|uniref:Reverse transcriptase Ty1/copia-type domain-containing protein n=1 Tax=Rubroshorea leprosula TaxID=152421 RepID=A0AAV5LYJ0_9ROSI|nr:hypothetical protein SLEP1_g49325 [Rubroshorea leprosula]
MKEDMSSMYGNGVWELVEIPVGFKPIDCKWIYKTKKDAKGKIKRFKARLVAKGYIQKEGIDYRETFSMVSSKDSFRIIMALIAHFDLELHQMDVKIAFLNGDLLEEVYMMQVEGFEVEGNEHMDCRAGVDPINKGNKLSTKQCPKNNLEKEQMKGVPYSSVVGSLMYSQVCTRPHMAFATSILRRYLSNPGYDHWITTKKALRYLRKTRDHMLVYRRVENLEVVGFTDTDFAGCTDNRKSTTGYIFMLLGGAISWKSSKQSIPVASTMEVEVITYFEAGGHAKWLRNFATELKVIDSIYKALKIYCDNSSTVSFSKSTKNTNGAKFIELKYFKIRLWVDNGDTEYEHIGTEDMFVDPLTKGLKPIDFERHVRNMGLSFSLDILG